MFPKIEVPKNGWYIYYIMENPIKIDDLLGVPLCSETPMADWWFQPIREICSKKIGSFSEIGITIYNISELPPPRCCTSEVLFNMFQPMFKKDLH